MGTPLGKEEERREILVQFPARMIEAHLQNTGRCRDRREATTAVLVATENTALTSRRLRELSVALCKARRERSLDEAACCRFVYEWMIAQGFLR